MSKTLQPTAEYTTDHSNPLLSNPNLSSVLPNSPNARARTREVGDAAREQAASGVTREGGNAAREQAIGCAHNAARRGRRDSGVGTLGTVSMLPCWSPDCWCLVKQNLDLEEKQNGKKPRRNR